ncbi:hypothetical protein NDU88_002300 [Pleurodeles waltl]|uniref:Uncharacterized protein n=1 Tax=Pleurodeles waltl TaxID=8319 RepID=A0AAV7S9X9_PLEWA|nr:hypothetical protein NDU88_002300 [Pleurodeles waltl]
MARNRKAALQTGAGSQALLEALDQVEEMLAAVIPEEIVTGIQGQDSADYQETTQMQVRGLPQHLASQTFHCVHDCNHDPLRADLAAYHSDVAAILKNQQLLLAAVMPLIAPQLADTGNSDSTSSNTEVCVAPSNRPQPKAEETTHTSEDEDVEQITFTRRSTR